MKNTLIIFLLFIFPFSVKAEMVVLLLNTESTATGKEPCQLIERGWASSIIYYKFEAEPGSGGCHSEIQKDDYYKMFQFCSVGSEKSSGNVKEKGYCSIYPSQNRKAVMFSAMPDGDGFYSCAFVCETNGSYSPNFKNKQ